MIILLLAVRPSGRIYLELASIRILGARRARMCACLHVHIRAHLSVSSAFAEAMNNHRLGWLPLAGWLAGRLVGWLACLKIEAKVEMKH